MNSAEHAKYLLAILATSRWPVTDIAASEAIAFLRQIEAGRLLVVEPLQGPSAPSILPNKEAILPPQPKPEEPIQPAQKFTPVPHRYLYALLR